MGCVTTIPGGLFERAELTADDPLFPSRVRDSPHLSTRQYARIVESWAKQVGLDRASIKPTLGAKWAARSSRSTRRSSKGSRRAVGIWQSIAMPACKYR
jgi:hypothetical protein